MNSMTILLFDRPDTEIGKWMILDRSLISEHLFYRYFVRQSVNLATKGRNHRTFPFNLFCQFVLL